jgi:hypothetical protein
LCLFDYTEENIPQLWEVASALGKSSVSDLTLIVEYGPTCRQIIKAIEEMKHLRVLNLYGRGPDLHLPNSLIQLHLGAPGDRNLRRFTPKLASSNVKCLSFYNYSTRDTASLGFVADMLQESSVTKLVAPIG